MCASLGCPELEHDPHYSDISLWAKRQDELIPIIEQRMQTFDSDPAVLDMLKQNRVPNGAMLSPPDSLDHEYFETRGTMRDIHDPIVSALELAGLHLRFSSQTDYSAGLTPLLGEHNDEILHDLLGYDGVHVQTLTYDGLRSSKNR